MNLIWIIQAKYLSNYKIELVFNNGFKGTEDLKDSLKGGVFESLKNKEYFKNFKKNSRAIKWEPKADFAKEYLYKLAQQG